MILVRVSKMVSSKYQCSENSLPEKNGYVTFVWSNSSSRKIVHKKTKKNCISFRKTNGLDVILKFRTEKYNFAIYAYTNTILYARCCTVCRVFLIKYIIHCHFLWVRGLRIFGVYNVTKYR